MAAGLRRPRIVEREMTFDCRRAGATRLPDRGPLRDAGALPRLDGTPDRRAAPLRVGRLDLLARRVEVVEAATEVNGRLAWGPAKTGERRTVPLPHLLAGQLGACLADRPHAPDDLVFTMPAGGPRRTPPRWLPKCGPRVAPPSSSYAKGQVNDLAQWWRWGDSNSRPAASYQGFSERSRRLRFGPGLSGGDAPGS